MQKILAAQLVVESYLNPNAYNSRSQAAGVAQFIPSTAKQYGVNVHSVESSVDGQARYMLELINRYNGNVVNALMAYNWGMGNVDKLLKGKKKSIPDETNRYVQKIYGIR